MKKINLLIIPLLPILMSGCAGNAQLYPANEKAQKMGAISLQYQANPINGLIGTVSGTMPDGEVLNGQYTSVDNRTYKFGSIYGSVYGSGSALATTGMSTTTAMGSYGSTGSASLSSMVSPGARYGTVNVIGDKGTLIDCEYMYNNSGGGTGACRTDKGALYKMQIR